MKRRVWSTVLAVVLVLSLLWALAACDFGDFTGVVSDILEELEKEQTTTQEKQKADLEEAEKVALAKEDLAADDLSFHFLTLGNKYTGDSTYIKMGDVDILIDAGSDYNSAPAIVNYVRNYCTDGVLEYVILTHGDKDHVAAFVGNSDASVLRDFQVGTIIDAPLTNATSKVFQSYCDLRDELVQNGTKHYNALECYRGENGAKRTYTLGKDVTMQFLYNYYYEHNTSNENNYSVCVLFSYGEGNHYLFTGDLEEKGEEYLVKYNELPYVRLFKGAHHGSKTANTELLMKTIQPDVVCVNCCCGSPQYSTNNDAIFPSQDFFNHVLPYTDKIYVTTMVADMDEEALARNEDKIKYSYTDMNGNIVVVAHGDSLKVYCSASTTPVPETEWFATHRTRP